MISLEVPGQNPEIQMLSVSEATRLNGRRQLERTRCHLDRLMLILDGQIPHELFCRRASGASAPHARCA